MAKYIQGTILSPGTLTPGNMGPIDDRFVVASKADLYAANTFTALDSTGQPAAEGEYIYPGLQVYVNETKETYLFVGPLCSNSASANIEAAKVENWRKISDANSSVDKVQDNLNKLAAAAGVSGTASADTFGYSAHTTPSFISEETPISIQTEVIAIEKALTPTTNTDIDVDSVRKLIPFVYMGAGWKRNADAIHLTQGEKLTIYPNDITKEASSGGNWAISASTASSEDKVTYDNLLGVQIDPTKELVIQARVDEDVYIHVGGVKEGNVMIKQSGNLHNNIISITNEGIEAFADLHYNSTTNKLTFVNTNGKKDIELTGVNFISGATYDKANEQIIIYYKKYGETSASTINVPVKDLIEEYDFKYASSGGTEYNKSFTVTDHNVSLKWTRDVSGTTSVYGDIDIFDCGTY